LTRKVGYQTDINRETTELLKALAKRIVAEKVGWKEARNFLRDLCIAEALVITPNVQQAASQLKITRESFLWKTRMRSRK